MELEAAAGFGVAEVGGGGVVEDEGGFEARAGEGVLDARDFFAEVEGVWTGIRAGRGDGGCGGGCRVVWVR